MNYDELKRSVKAVAPCSWRLVPIWEVPSPCPYGMLLFIMEDDGRTALAMFNGGRIRVSATQVSELMELAQGHGKGERSVSEIRVGDKVRVVQIIVREPTRASDVAYMEGLGKEGTVTAITTGAFCNYGVLLSGETISHYFNREELKLLSVPCEQQESKIFSPRFKWYAANREIRILTRSNARLIKEKELLGAENDRLATRLLDQLGISRQLQKRWDDVLRADERAHREGIALADQIKVNEGLRESLAGKIVFIGRLQKRGKELREQYDNLLRTSAGARAEIRVILNRSPHISQG